MGAAATYRDANHQADHVLAAWEAEPGSRLHFYHEVWAALQPLDEAHRQSALEAILDWAGDRPSPRETHRPLTRAELQQLEKDNVVSIGAHTVNHPLLSKRTLADQQQEILASKAYLESVLNHSVDTFAYPFGAYAPETVDLLDQAGFLCACTTAEETLWRGNGCYELPRFDVANWPGPMFEQQMLRWFEKGYAA